MHMILDYLEQTEQQEPMHIAFADPTKEITFQDLTLRAQQAATLFSNGTFGFTLGEEEPVCFFMEKCVDAIAAMFGAIYCGAFYSFTDIRQPAERVQKVLSVLHPTVIITDEAHYPVLMEYLAAASFAFPVLLISDLLKEAGQTQIDETALKRKRSGFTDQMPLYVNFTSGSTGTPKGVVVSHRSVIDFITVFVDLFGINQTDILANQAPFDFDVSIKDIFSGIFTGARVQLVPREYFTNPTTLMDYLCDHNVTTLVWAVSAMCFVSIMNGFGYRVPGTIRRVLFSGEVMPVKQLNKWRTALPDATYVNVYGPTEITCNCTYHILDREYEKTESIPIGTAFPNEKVFLLDDADRLVTQTEQEGEICVGGTCLAIGYFKDPEKTAAVFTQNPLNDRYEERIYRTGDIGKYDASGNLLYVGRKDFQIKHMGQRIELGEIEVCAMSLEGVQRAVSIYDFKRQKIILFYAGELEKDSLAEQIQSKLPPFMLPNKTIRLEQFPMNKNGKVDRKALEELI
ncbi:MAG: amino acid adenylation domain-containing protein [bacterium]|nr:amino acid adenylation domain-containing protein [bacterium]